MTYPVVHVMIEVFGGIELDYGDALRSCKTRRGRRRAIEPPTAGVANLIFGNEDRTMDPEYSGSVLDVGQKIRVYASWGGTDYPIFSGTIDRIMQKYDAPRGATAELECTDATADLEKTNLISTWEVTMKGWPKRQWLRFGESAGTIAHDSSGNGRDAHIAPFVSMGENGLQFGDPDSAYKFDQNGYVLLLPGSFGPLLPFSINFTLNMPPPAVDTHLLYDVYYPNGLRIWVDTLGRLNVQCVANGLQVSYARTNEPVTGNSKQISIQFQAGQPIRIWNTGAYDNVAQAGTGAVGVNNSYHVLGYVSNATIDEWFITDYIPTPAQYQSLMDSNPNGWAFDTVEERINRILSYIGWDLADIEWYGSDTNELLPTVLGETALEHIQALMDTIEGTAFVTADGKLRIVTRQERDSSPYADSQATFGDGAGELGYVGMSGYSLDTELVTNIVRRYNLEVATMVQDLDSIAKYGPRDHTSQSEVESLFIDPSQDGALAQYRLAHLKDALPTLDDLVLMPEKTPATHWPQALGRELTERITLVRRPQNVGAPIEREMIIEGIEHDIAPKKWTTIFNIDAINALRFFQFDYIEWDDPDWRFG